MSMRKKMKVALLSTVLGSAPITSSVVLPIATQFGKATIGTVVGVGALVAGTIAAVKVFKVGGIAASKIGVGALGKGAIGTAGKIGAGTLGKGAIGTAGLLGSATVAAKAEAITMLQTIAMTTLKRNSTILTKEKFSPLYIKYPELSKALGNPNKLDNIARLNPEFSDDLALAMYRSNPELFTLGFKESKILKLIPRSFDDVIQINVSRQASHEADSIIQGAVRRLEQDGLDLSKLSTMEAAKLEKLLAESVTAELNGMARSPGYQWGYNSGKLFVKGEVGHFSFQQELAISGIAISVLAGAGTVAGYHYGWENNKFNRIHSCVGSFCLEIKENTSSNQQTKGISID